MSIDRNKNKVSREDKIKKLNSTTTFELRDLKKMSDIELNELWDNMEGNDWMTEPDTESEHNMSLEKRQHLLSFEKFNEELDLDGYDNSGTTESLVIKLELPIDDSIVESVQNKLTEMGIKCGVEKVLTEFFMYQSGYNFDETWSVMDEWIDDNQDDLQDL